MFMGELLTAGDSDADGSREWVAAIPDGTIRFYARDGTELGRQAMGEYVTALAAEEPQKPGERSRLWAALGDEVVALEWQTW